MNHDSSEKNVLLEPRVPHPGIGIQAECATLSTIVQGSDGRAWCCRAALVPFKIMVCLLWSSGCNGLVSDGGTDTSTNWYHSCDEDADCGQALSCLCGMCTQPCEPEAGCPTLPGARCETDNACAVQKRVCVAEPEGGSVVESGRGEDSSSETKALPLVSSLDQCELVDERATPDQHGLEYACAGINLATSCWEASDTGQEVFCICSTATPLATLFEMDAVNDLFPSAQSAEGDALIVRPTVWFDGSPLDVAVSAASAACFRSMLDPMQGHCVDDASRASDQCLASRECAAAVDVSVGPNGTLRVGKQLDCMRQGDFMRCRCGETEQLVSLGDFESDYCEAHLNECFQRTDDW